MDKIEVGEYVRTKRGIGKIIEVKTVQTKMYGKHDVVYLIDKCPHMYITETEFIKHSKNKIGIVKKGDYVNGSIVYEIGQAENGQKWIHTLNGLLLYEQDIKSIVTHEQFESVKYNFEEEEYV